MDISKITDDFIRILKLDTEPIAVKLLKNKGDARSGIVKKQINVCQLVANARHQQRTSTGVPEHMVCSLGAAALGLIKTPEAFVDGTAAVNIYTKTKEAGKEFFKNTYKIGDSGKKFEATEIGPLRKHEDFDVFVVYVNPGQALGLIHANSFLDGSMMKADTVAEGALCSAIGFAFGEQKPIIGFPCAGDRRFASTQHSELVFAAPMKELSRMHDSLLELFKLGPIYPVPPMVDYETRMSRRYTISEKDLI
ncbi:MAG: DUF169 domain-containing protein [Caldisericia bacterium]|nr:DUF169 domain-containing protein [Caldisericia bacterium]